MEEHFIVNCTWHITSFWVYLHHKMMKFGYGNIMRCFEGIYEVCSNLSPYPSSFNRINLIDYKIETIQLHTNTYIWISVYFVLMFQINMILKNQFISLYMFQKNILQFVRISVYYLIYLCFWGKSFEILQLII